MDQSLAVTLRQLCYGKISFIALVPGDDEGRAGGRSDESAVLRVRVECHEASENRKSARIQPFAIEKPFTRISG